MLAVSVLVLVDLEVHEDLEAQQDPVDHVVPRVLDSLMTIDVFHLQLTHAHLSLARNNQ